MKGLDVPISELVSELTLFGDREVADRTGIEGRFDIDLERPEDPNDPPIFTLLQDAGLALGISSRSARYICDRSHRAPCAQLLVLRNRSDAAAGSAKAEEMPDVG
jgi:uncharacterized protein (TIGR03435 family)